MTESSNRIKLDPITDLPESDIWIVRAGRKGKYARLFLEDKIVGIGWADVGEILPSDSDDVIHQRFWQAYPYDKPGTHAASFGQVIRFHRQMAVGDAIATYSNEERLYHVGLILSDASHYEPGEQSEESLGFVRQVEWKYLVRRDDLSPGTRNSLGSALTLFRLPPDASAELRRMCLGDGQIPQNDGSLSEEADLDSPFLLKDYTSRAEEAISDRIARLSWDELQELVAGILRAMGYRTRVSDPGPDRGVDVFASPDGLGLQEPRIFVEVKHRTGSVSASQIRSLMGGRNVGDRCLYVSTGGYSREARYEAERSTIPLNLIAMPELMQLLFTHYEGLDSETRALVPLKRIYVPIDE